MPDLEHHFKNLHNIGAPWCLKVPLLSVTVALWEHLVTDPVLVITVRNPYDTVKSLLKLEDKKANEEDIILYLLGWQHYMARILKDTAKFDRRFFISYEEVIENPGTQITKLVEFLGQQFPNSPNQEGAVQEMQEMVESKLHRNSGGLSFDERNEATQTQKELYTLLQKIAKDQTVPTHIDYDKYQLTKDEIKTLQKNNRHVLQNLGKRSAFRRIWNICKYMISKLRIE